MMEKQSDGGLAVTLAAVCAAIAGAVTRHLLARLWRAPLKREDETVCRNHSHVAGKLLNAYSTEHLLAVKMWVEQPLTLEISPGSKLTLPSNTVLQLLAELPTVSSDSPPRPMGELGVADLFKVVEQSTSGPTTQKK